MINVEEVINDPDFAQYFVIHRREGQFVKGIWTPNPVVKKVKCFGPVIAANEKELIQVPEGDRIRGVMVFYTPAKIPIYVTHLNDGSSGTSDEILWDGDFFKIFSVNLYRSYGYWKGIGARMKGS